MKKTLCLILLIVLCFSAVACGKNLEAVEEVVQGNWVRSEEVQSSTQVTLSLDKGSATRNETTNSETKTLTGEYTINSDGDVVISYTDGSTQTLSCLVSERGYILVDHVSGVTYTKNN